MKLYIKQQVFTLGDRFDVYDEYQRSVFHVEGEFLKLVDKLHVYDTYGVEVAYIEGVLFSLLDRYKVYVRGNQYTEIEKQFTLFRPKYEFHGIGWTVDGDFWGHDYSIYNEDNLLATIHKKWISFGDFYELDIDDTIDAVNVLAVVLAIDCSMRKAAAASSAAHD